MRDYLLSAAVLWPVFIGCGLVYLVWQTSWNNRKAKPDAEAMLESFVKNVEAQWGRAPDGPSIVWLSQHPRVSARLWHLLGVGGARGGPLLGSEESDEAHRLGSYVTNRQFAERYPGAHALIQYAVYLNAATHSGKSVVPHPADEDQTVAGRPLY